METVETKKTRKPRAAAEYLLQQRNDSTGIGHGTWSERIEQSFSDVADAKKYVRDNGLEGTFRVVRVCCIFTAAKETTTVTRLSA